MQALAERNAALRNMAGAAQQQAEAAQAQFRLNSQIAGAPQVFVPGVGMVPYAYGTAPAASQYPPYFGNRSGNAGVPAIAPGSTNGLLTPLAPAAPLPLLP